MSMLDWYVAYTVPCTDCAGLTAVNAYKDFRGGAFSDPVSSLVPSGLGALSPVVRDRYAGFRCARIAASML